MASHPPILTSPANLPLNLVQVPFDANESDLLDFFGRYGKVSDVSIYRHARTGDSKGCGIVTFGDLGTALDVIRQVHGKVRNHTNCVDHV